MPKQKNEQPPVGYPPNQASQDGQYEMKVGNKTYTSPYPYPDPKLQENWMPYPNAPSSSFSGDFRMWEEYYNSRADAGANTDIPPIVVPVDPWKDITDQYMQGINDLMSKYGEYQVSPEDKQALANAEASLQQKIAQGVTNVGTAYDGGAFDVRDIAQKLVQQGKTSGENMGNLFRDAASDITNSSNEIGVQGLDQYGGIGGVTVPTGEAQTMANLLMSFAPAEQALVTNLGQIYGADQQAYANSMMQQKANDLAWLQSRGQDLQQQMANEYLKREADRRTAFDRDKMNLQTGLMADALKSIMGAKTDVQLKQAEAEAYDKWLASQSTTQKSAAYVPSHLSDKFNNIDAEISTDVPGSDGTVVPTSIIKSAVLAGLLVASQYDDPNQKALMYGKTLRDELGGDMLAYNNIVKAYPTWSPMNVFGTFKTPKASTTTTTKTASSKTTSTRS